MRGQKQKRWQRDDHSNSQFSIQTLMFLLYIITVNLPQFSFWVIKWQNTLLCNQLLACCRMREPKVSICARPAWSHSQVCQSVYCTQENDSTERTTNNKIIRETGQNIEKAINRNLPPPSFSLSLLSVYHYHPVFSSLALCLPHMWWITKGVLFTDIIKSNVTLPLNTDSLLYSSNPHTPPIIKVKHFWHIVLSDKSWLSEPDVAQC